jgi:hypothetical protein
MTTVWVNDRGDELQDLSQLQQDDQGYFQMEDSLDSVCCEILPLHYRDCLHTPNARWEEEITWKAYRSVLTRKQFKKQFGDKFDVPFQTIKADDKTPEDEKLLPVEYAIIWEIWDKDEGDVKWLCEGYRESLLKPLNLQKTDDQEESELDYELDNFFPSPPFILGTCGPDGMFPVPDYVQLRPLIGQLHGLADRLQQHVLALKSTGIYDGAVPGLKEALENVQSGQFKALNNFAELVDDKTPGLEKILRFFPMQEISETIRTIIEVVAQYENKFNEIYGIPDIVRGVTDPNETADAQQRKGQYHSIRTSTRSRQFQAMVRDTVEIACDLMWKKFPERKLREIVGVKHWDMQDQQKWPEVLLLLQDDDERKIRVDIETDSTIAQDEAEEIEQASFLAKTLTDGLAAVAAAVQQNPLFGPPAMGALEMVIGKTRYGRYLEPLFRKAKESFTQQLENPSPPPPDPRIQVEQMKQQGKMQELQIKSGLDQQKMQGDFQIAQAKSQSDMQLEQIQAQADIQTTMAKIQAEVQQSQIEGAAKIQIESQLAQLDAQLKILEASLRLKEHQVGMIHDMHSTALDLHSQKVGTALDVWNAQEAAKLERQKANNAYKAPQ